MLRLDAIAERLDRQHDFPMDPGNCRWFHNDGADLVWFHLLTDSRL